MMDPSPEADDLIVPKGVVDQEVKDKGSSL